MKQGAFAEVVSEFEYKIALKLEVKRIEYLAKSINTVVKISIRLTEKSDADVWDKFGFSLHDSSVIDIIKYINKSSSL